MRRLKKCIGCCDTFYAYSNNHQFCNKDCQNKRNAKILAERIRVESVVCRACGDEFVVKTKANKSKKKTCSAGCAAQLTKMQGGTKLQRKNRLLRMDRLYDTRDFDPDYEIKHPYVVDTMLAEAHERNQGRSYRYRCATCATRITDEAAAVKHKGDWFGDVGCFRLRTSQCYWRRRYRPGQTAASRLGYRRKEG